MKERYASIEELNLIRYLLSKSNINDEVPDIIKVSDMTSGSGKSIHILSDRSQEKRRFGLTIAQEEFIDEDDVPIIAFLATDEVGDLLELDLWKVDSSTPILKYPSV